MVKHQNQNRLAHFHFQQYPVAMIGFPRYYLTLGLKLSLALFSADGKAVDRDWEY